MVRIWKEVFLAYFKVLWQLWLREGETSHEKMYSRKRVAQCKLETRGQAKIFSGAAVTSHCSLEVQIILTYSMVQSPSWEANCFAASQEIPRISRNPTVHYRTHKRPPPVSILGQPNPVHIPTSHLMEIDPNIIHPSTPRSPQWSPFLRFPQQDPIHPLSSPIRATCPAHLICVCACVYMCVCVCVRVV